MGKLIIDSKGIPLLLKGKIRMFCHLKIIRDDRGTCKLFCQVKPRGVKYSFIGMIRRERFLKFAKELEELAYIQPGNNPHLDQNIKYYVSKKEIEEIKEVKRKKCLKKKVEN